MSKATKGWLIAAVILILSGLLLLIGGVLMMESKFPQLSTNPFETNEHTIEQSFTHLWVDTDTAQVHVVPAEGDTVRVVCREWAKEKHTVTVQDGTLTITVVDTRKWYDHIGIHIDSPSVTVELPARAYGALQIRGETGSVEVDSALRFAEAEVTLSTGSIRYCAPTDGGVTLETAKGRIRGEGFSADALKVTVSTGQVQLRDLQCGSLTAAGNTGSIGLWNVAVEREADIRRSTGKVTLTDTIAAALTVHTDTGDVSFERCDADDIRITTDTGDVEGSLCTGKTFITRTDTGRVTVPDTAGGRCEITTDTGDIRVEINP